MKNYFLTLKDIRRDEISEIFKIAAKIKNKPVKKFLLGRTICLFFEKPSTRTRISFEVGIKQLGGEVVHLDRMTSQLSRGESIEDTARVLERYVDAIVARVYKHRTLETMVKVTNIPIINALSDLCHPCQVLSDLFTLKEKFKDFQGLKLAYVGDGNNVCNSLLLGCSKVGISIFVACPKNYEPNKEFIEEARRYARLNKCKVMITHDPKKAVKHAHVIYTDTFVSMGQEKEKKKRLKVFKKYKVTQELIDYAGSSVLFMHCLPAHRGEEVDKEVIDGHNSIVFDQAENRLHVQKALLIKMLGRLVWE